MYEHTKAIVDRLAQTWKGGSASRPLLLSAVQQANGYVWGYADWWWKRRADTLLLDAGVRSYSVAECQRVGRQTLRHSAGGFLTFVEPSVWAQIYAGDESSGTPSAWTERPLLAGVVQIDLWPTPAATPGQLLLEKVESVDTLEDSDSSVPRVPLDWREALVAGAFDVLGAHGQQVQTQQLQYSKCEAVLKRLLDEQGRHRRAE